MANKEPKPTNNRCPDCGSSLKKNDVGYLRCPNTDCKNVTNYEAK